MSTREVMAARRSTAAALIQAASHAVSTQQRYEAALVASAGEESAALGLWRRAHIRAQLLLAEALHEAAEVRTADLSVFALRGWASTIRRGVARYGALARTVSDELAEERDLRGVTVAG